MGAVKVGRSEGFARPLRRAAAGRARQTHPALQPRVLSPPALLGVCYNGESLVLSFFVGSVMGGCCLVAACEFNRDDFLRRYREGLFERVIAVDGGFGHLEGVGCVPDVVIGDFDSLGYVPEGECVIAHPAHKDKSDLELALDMAAEYGFGFIVVYGALGGRLDHSVANLQMCARFAESGMNIELVGADCTVSFLVGPGELQLPALHGTVSVFSAVNESYGVTIRGMEYPLGQATLTNRTTLGLSNELIGRPASVAVEQGTLLVFTFAK